MTIVLVGTDEVATSEAICDYLERRVGPDDVVVVVNSLPGPGDAELVEAGQRALDVFEERLGSTATVETRQSTGGSDPTDDILSTAVERDADEIVIGLDQQRSAVGKIVFGSVCQAVLFNADRPVVAVPLPDSD